MSELPIIARAIPEVGGGWVIALSIMSKRLDPWRAEGWTFTPSGAYRGKSASIMQHAKACYCVPGEPHVQEAFTLAARPLTAEEGASGR